jgi:hypothetical protein
MIGRIPGESQTSRVDLQHLDTEDMFTGLLVMTHFLTPVLPAKRVKRQPTQVAVDTATAKAFGVASATICRILSQTTRRKHALPCSEECSRKIAMGLPAAEEISLEEATSIRRWWRKAGGRSQIEPLLASCRNE